MSVSGSGLSVQGPGFRFSVQFLVLRIQGLGFGV